MDLSDRETSKIDRKYQIVQQERPNWGNCDYFYMEFTLKWPNFSYFSKLRVIAIDFGCFVAKYC